MKRIKNQPMYKEFLEYAKATKKNLLTSCLRKKNIHDPNK